MSAADRRVVLAIDPGRDKCGVAVCEPGAVRGRAVIAPSALPDLVREWHRQYGVTEVVVGNRTASQDIVRLLDGVLDVPVIAIDEEGTTLRARTRYFDEHPPRGWRRLIPRGLMVPPEPYDDYAAVLLAEAALSAAPRAVHAETRGGEGARRRGLRDSRG